MTGPVARPALTMQDAVLTLQRYWAARGAMLAQPSNTEVGAGTMNPATILRTLGPEPWCVAYVEPSVRPDDSRYGENPNRLQTHTQFQVVMKPEPGHPQDLYLGSLEALGIDTGAHDVRFVEDNWAQPAIGAWGLGWEVWLDGLEITQFTYFQQMAGQELDPVAVEVTYGLERILMSLQGVTHFADLVYAPGLTYGELFGQTEYEMSRYYLDVADVEGTWQMYRSYVTQAQALLEERLPVAAHTYLLKSSHAFNILDARGAIGTTERARAFATMRALAGDTATLWLERRAELHFPLLRSNPAGTNADGTGPAEHLAEPSPDTVPGGPQDFVLEIGFEELPAHVVDRTIAAVADAAGEALTATSLAHGAITVGGTTRRIVLTVRDVASREEDATLVVRGPRVSSAWDEAGAPTRALDGFLRSRHLDLTAVSTRNYDGTDYVTAQVHSAGRPAIEVLASVSERLVRGLRADRNMRWNDPELVFSRPVRWLVALLGEQVVPVRVSHLSAGRRTHLQRRAQGAWRDVESAGALADAHIDDGIVVDRNRRRQEIRRQVDGLARGFGGHVDFAVHSDLLDEVTNLVEDPRAVLGRFADKYLELPPEVLTTVMRKHQRYFPVNSATGSMLPYFVAVANGSHDEAVVRAGNESVLRARYEDASFFWAADLQVPLEDFRESLSSLIFEEHLGSVARRVSRIADTAGALAAHAGLDPAEAATLARACRLAKFDLATSMVTELPSLAGTMAREYALRAGEGEAVARALYEMEQPHTGGDDLPTSRPGALLSIADRAELLVAMFALGQQPTGSSDPFALRRAALGAVRVLASRSDLGDMDLPQVVRTAARRLREDGVEIAAEIEVDAVGFAAHRFEQFLRARLTHTHLIQAVDLHHPRRASLLLDELESLRTDVEFQQLVVNVHRITRIVPPGTPAGYDVAHLPDPSDSRLVLVVEALADSHTAGLRQWAQDCRVLRCELSRYFETTLVMTDEPDVRAARLGLLQTIVARAPSGLRWDALGTQL